MATIAQLPPRQPPPPQASHPWPLYDLCLDVPHPAASSSCPPPFMIGSPIVDPAIAEELPKNVPQIARFAFPEYDEQLEKQHQAAAQASNNAASLNKYDQYAMQPKSFQNFTFSMQLSTGQRMYGHVRRYLPPHLVARTRYDVGRRGERALVILTRASGADQLYAAILKSVEAITSQQAALPSDLQAHKEPKKWFLHSLFMYQQHLAKVYASKPAEERGKPLIAALEGLELGNYPRYKSVDTNRFIIPTSLLHRSSLTEASLFSSILPLLRCVGVAHALRIMAALLSERRVVMVSSSPTRLATCSHAALSMVAQGLMHWQHLYIPVLPTHLWQYLAAPYPYLIGILAANAVRLDQTDGLGEVLIIQLDSNTMETRGMPNNIIQSRLPDLFQNQDVQHQLAGSSAVEFLAQDLQELLKVDKRTLYGESTLSNMGETAVKATKALKGTFLKLRDKGRQYLQQQRSGAGSEDEAGSGNGNGENNNEAAVVAEDKSMAADYIYTEGCHNEIGEEEARIAFATFFLCMFGDMRWYLTAKPGQAPQLDRERYLQQRRSMGDGEGTTMWPLLQNVCQTQMLEEFAKARIEEVRSRQAVTPDAPLFLQCANYHRHHSIDFGIINVRRVARQVAEGSPSRLTGMLQTNARRMAMTLTSNKGYEGDYSKAIAQLVEQCRESTSVLFDVMSVVWLRLRDMKGLQWKHGYQALQLLRNLLYHGPMAVIAEATDGLDKIRAMKYYENMRSQIVQQVRTAAQNVYNLLVDRTKLFYIRRVCADRRQLLQDPRSQPQLVRDTRLNVTLSFRSIHLAMNPNTGATIARIPPAAPTQSSMQRGPPQAAMQRDQSGDLLGMPPSPQARTAPPPSAADMFGLFDSMAVSTPSPATLVPQQQSHAPPNAAAQSNPFGTQVPVPPVATGPMMAPVPPAEPLHAPPQAPAQYGQPPHHFSGQTPQQPGYPHTKQVPAPSHPHQSQQPFYPPQPGGYQQQPPPQQHHQPPPHQQPQQPPYQQPQQPPHQQPQQPPYQQPQQPPHQQPQQPQGQGGTAQARAQFDPFL